MERKPLPLFNVDQPESFPPTPVEIIPGVLYEQLLTTLWGSPEAGKSHIALDLACTVAQVHPVVYVAAEASFEIGLRSEAWKLEHDATCNNRLIVWGEPVLLMQAENVHRFVQGIQAIKPKVVFFDPLAQCLMGGDESSTRDMTVATYHLNQVARHFNAAVCVIHHTGWNKSRERGSSVLRGASRISISAQRLHEGPICLKIEKQNSGQRIPTRYFEIKQTTSPLHTVAIPVIREDAANSTTGKLPKRQREILTALGMPLFEHGVSKVELWRYAEAAYKIGHSSAYHTINALIKRELATTSKSGLVFITEAGRLELDFGLDSDPKSDGIFLPNTLNWNLPQIQSVFTESNASPISNPMKIQSMKSNNPIPPPSIGADGLDSLDKESGILVVEDKSIH